MYYAKKYIPEVSRSKSLLSSSSSSSVVTKAKHKERLETMVSNLLLEKGSKAAMATRFLFGLLRATTLPKPCWTTTARHGQRFIPTINVNVQSFP